MSGLAYLYLCFVAFTSRIRIRAINPEASEHYKEGRPVIFSYWNENIFFLLYFFSRKQYPILMTPQKKTDFLTKLSQKMGLRVSIGSFEGGGRHALLNLLDQLRQGHPVCLSADGSRGPSKIFKAGSFILAQDAHVPILPINWKGLFQFKLPLLHKRFIRIPLPFNRIEIILGRPYHIERNYLFEELEAIKPHLVERLEEISR